MARRWACAIVAALALSLLSGASFAFPPDWGPEQENPAALPQRAEPEQAASESGETETAEEGKAGPGDRTERLPNELSSVTVTEHLGETIDLDLEFVDQDGETRKLREYFVDGRPVILNLGYYRCPMLCSLVTRGLLGSIDEMDWMPGADYQVLTISIDPSETVALAKVQQQDILRDLRSKEAASGWHFFVGRQEAITKLAEQVGFGYERLPNGEFAHAAVIMVITPDGRVSRYLYGVRYPQKTLRLSLVEASDGAIGSAVDQILLFCFHYNASDGKYSVAAMNLMRLGGALTLFTLVGVVGIMLLRGPVRRAAAKSRNQTIETSGA